jgi:hypothetical protein
MDEASIEGANFKLIKRSWGGRRPGSGRKKGTPNKYTATLREALDLAFNRLGGVDWLVGIAQDDPRAFIMLLSRSMPPATKNPEAAAGLAESIANARERIYRAREAERRGLRLLSDEELAEKLEQALEELRSSPGNPSSNVVTDTLRRALNNKHEMTLGELLEGSWDKPRMVVETGVPHEPVGEPVPAPAPIPPQRPVPVVKPEPSPIRVEPLSLIYEQLPGQAVNSHRRPREDNYGSSSGMSVHDYNPLDDI